jgi:dienelactone hydrolase
MRWLRRIAIGFAILAGLVILAGVALWIWKPWVPPVEVVDPGPGGRRITDAGLLANYYPGTGTGRRPALLALGGSEGGIGTAVDAEARALASAGFPVLVMSYFRAPGQPAALENIPLEGFTRAIDWLAAQPEVDPARLGVIGGSKGAEAGLLIASRDSRLRAVAVGMPSNVVWQGFDWETFSSDGASWSAGGKPLAFLPIGRGDWSNARQIDQLYINGLKALPEHPEAVIPVERIAGPVLLLCGEDDTLWPSCPMARAVAARAAERHGPPVTLLAYKGAGHGVMGLPRTGDTSGLDVMGGTNQGNNAARIDGWPKLVAFLQQALAAPAAAQAAP